MSASDVGQAAIDAAFAEFGREAFHNGGRRRSPSSSICAMRAHGLTMGVRSRARSPSRCAKAKSSRLCMATPSLSAGGP